MLLGEILIRRKRITYTQIHSALIQQKRTGKKLGEILLDLKLVLPDSLDSALKEQYWRKNGYWVISMIDKPIKKSLLVLP